MQLTRYTDYALRVLIYAGMHEQRLVTIPEIAQVFGISYNHLVKVVHRLASAGYLESTRGKHGGIRLGRKPQAIGLGEVVRHMELHLAIAECFDTHTCSCRITTACLLRQVLREATMAFHEVLNRYTLADLLENRSSLLDLLLPSPQSPASVSGTPTWCSRCRS